MNELARMLGGAAITEGLRASAREMLAERAVRERGERRRQGERRKRKSESERQTWRANT